MVVSDYTNGDDNAIADIEQFGLLAVIDAVDESDREILKDKFGMYRCGYRVRVNAEVDKIADALLSTLEFSE